MKTAFVTGCSSGIGLRTCLALARDGYVTYGSMRDRRREGPLQEAASKAGVKINVVEMDLTSEESIGAVADHINTHGGADVLVNNAGYGQFGTAEETPVDDFRAQFETGLFGVISLIQKILPPMRTKKSGRIVNVGSVAGRMGLPGCTAYICANFALEGLTECLRHELEPFGIQATIIEPGVVKTPFFSVAKIAEPADPQYQNIMNQIMAGLQMMASMGTDPDVVAGVIARALQDPEMLPRYQAGSDAVMFMDAKNTRSDLEFEKYMRQEVFSR